MLMESNTIFEDLADLTDMVINGIQPSVVITGMAGIGKTQTVKHRIKHANLSGNDYKFIKGYTSTMGLYTTLYHNRQKLVIFDDCDAVFKDSTSVNILKAALDSYDSRTISWKSRVTTRFIGMSTIQRRRAKAAGKIPSEFEFEGGIIFISNFPASAIDPAVLSRSFVIDVVLTREEIVNRIDEILPKLMPEVALDFKESTLTFFKNEPSTAFKEFNIRTFTNAIKIRQSTPDGWENLVKKYA